MSDKRVVIAPSRAELAALVADKFVVRIGKLLRRKGHASVVLTGGSVGIEVLAAIADHAASAQLDWSQVDLWWGDERFVPEGSAERNDGQADEVFISKLAFDPARVNRVTYSDSSSLDEAAADYGRKLRAAAPEGEQWPIFDIAFAGMGPDGHVLSVFPGSDQARSTEVGVSPVRNSPKPPPERVTMLLALLNRADRVWMVVAGADKAAALGLMLAEAATFEVPAAGLKGRHSTKVFIDSELAELIPAELVTRQQFWSASDERADYVPHALR